MIKLLPFLLDFAAKKIIQSLNDGKETKLDKVIRFLISDKVSNSINKFYIVYIEAVEKLNGSKGIDSIIEESSKDL